MNLLIIVTAVAIAGYLIFSRKLAKSSRWKATVTPLASIMGSGFLISAPLLAGTVGIYATFCMAALLLVAYGVGGAIRFNIRYYEPIQHEKGAAQRVAFISRVILAIAYFISITYYLQLLAAFVLNALDIQSQILANIITTSLLVLIGTVGIWRGLSMLENVTKYAVSLNLGMVGALLVGLFVYNAQLVTNGSWALPNISSTIDLGDIRILFGLLIVIQGFETSRYLGAEHSADERIATMKVAQLLSAAIYLTFIALATVLFHSGFGSDVTAIVSMTRPVALVLPILLSVAAICSQFSAAVADNEGAGGLIEEIGQSKLSTRYVYMLILVITIILTWATNVNEIIAYASRAFALFYSLQCLVALIIIWKTPSLPGRLRQLLGFGFLSFICICVVVFGIPSG